MNPLKHRHLFGEKNLRGLDNKKVTIIGTSSVGSTVAEILSRAGLSLRLIDKGRVEEEDLMTSSLYTKQDIKKFKAKEAKKLLEQQTIDAHVKTFHEELNDKNIFLIDADVVIDCSNQLNTNEVINKRCKAAKLTCITVAYAGSQFLIFCSQKGYNLKKIKPHIEKLGSVAEKGLLSAVGHTAGGMAAAEAIKALLNQPLPKKGAVYDLLKSTKKEFLL